MLQKFPINVTKVPHVTEVPFFRYKSAGSYGSLSLSLSLSLLPQLKDVSSPPTPLSWLLLAYGGVHLSLSLSLVPQLL